MGSISLLIQAEDEDILLLAVRLGVQVLARRDVLIDFRHVVSGLLGTKSVSLILAAKLAES